MLNIENSHHNKANLISSLKMDYSIINHDSDTLLSVDLELNLADFDMFGVNALESQEENQSDDKVDPWSEFQNNSLDMNAGFDLSYAVMVNPRTVMADMSSHGSISRNAIIDTHSVSNVNGIEHTLDGTETSESAHWSIHKEQNSSETESDEYYGATESEEESDKQINDKDEEKEHNDSSQQFPENQLKSKITLSKDITQSPFTQTTETYFSKSKHTNINNIELQKIKIFQHSGQTQQLRRQIYNNNIQARLSSQNSLPVLQQNGVDNNTEKKQRNQNNTCEKKCYPKPTYSYSCLIAMALKNSETGLLPVSEIYKFMCDHFPYFKTAPSGWKNSVRHNLSLNKCFEKVEKADTSGNQRKGCLWAINNSRKQKMDEEMKKWSTKDRSLILSSLLNPEFLKPLENGELKHLYQNSGEQIISVSETDSTSTEELGNSVDSGLQTSYHQNFKQIITTNSSTDSEEESSRDVEHRLTQKTCVQDNVDDQLISFKVTSQKNTAVFNINQIKKSPIFEKKRSTTSSINEIRQTNNFSAYQFSLPSDSTVHQIDKKSKINPDFQYKQVNSNSDSCNSWCSTNSNISISDDCCPNHKSDQAGSRSEYPSNQRSKKRQKSFMGLIHRTGCNAQSVIEVRRKIPVSRERSLSSSLQY